MTVKNDFLVGTNFATWCFSENAPVGNGKIVLNRHFVLRGSPVSVKPGLTRTHVLPVLSRTPPVGRPARPPPGWIGGFRGVWAIRARRRPSETPARANPAQGSASMSSYQSWFRRDDRLPLLNQDWYGPSRLVAQGSAIALEVPAGKRTPRSTRSGASGGGRRMRVRVNPGLM